MGLMLNGQPVDDSPLAQPAFVNYGHFSSMQVRDGGVRGLERHLRRLDEASRELFGSPLPHERSRAALRAAIGDGTSPLSLRVNVFARDFDPEHPERPATPDLLTRTTAGVASSDAPLRLRSVVHRRVLPHLKHVATLGLFHARRQARLAGADDALLVDDDGRIGEASIWNIGFHDGERIVWPDAPMLAGITLQLVQAGLDAMGVEGVVRPVSLADLPRYRAAFLLHSADIGRPVASIDGHAFDPDDALQALLRTAYERHPLERP